jgi:protein TonB
MNDARQARQRLAACLFLSLALHLLLTLLPGKPPGRAAAAQTMKLTVRLPGLNTAATATLSSLEPAEQEATAAAPPPPDVVPDTAPGPSRADSQAAASTAPEANDDGPSQPAERHYYSESELDVWPFAQGHIGVEPAALAGLKEGGKVVVHVWINDSGKVERIGVERNALPPVYSQLAAEALAKTVFMPAMKNGHPVDSRIRIEIEYQAQP